MPWPRRPYDQRLASVLRMIEDFYRGKECIEIDVEECFAHAQSIA